MRLETTDSAIDAEIDVILRTLASLREMDTFPFPYQDIGHIYRAVTSRKNLTRRLIRNDFITDLDLYFMDIVSYSHWTRACPELSVEDRRFFVKYYSQDFFDRYPKYLPILRWITEGNAPALFRDFVLYEESRITVLALIRLLDQLENQQNGNRTSQIPF